MVIILRVICPQSQVFFSQILGWVHALEILDTALLLGYTIVVHSVYNKTNVSHRWYDLEVKGQGH